MPFNPKSLKNLRPRTPEYEEAKTPRRITLTPLGWEKLESLRKRLGYPSRSALIEGIAREELLIVPNLKYYKR